jgi:CBS domain-containing protein
MGIRIFETMIELVKDYMIVKKEVVTPDDSVSSAIELMFESDIGSVIIEDEGKKAIVGIFTERDILRHYMINQSKFLHLKISEVMTSPVVTVMRDTKLTDAIKLMKENDIGRLPVVDKNGRLAGILFWKDIFHRTFLEKNA